MMPTGLTVTKKKTFTKVLGDATPCWKLPRVAYGEVKSKMKQNADAHADVNANVCAMPKTAVAITL